MSSRYPKPRFSSSALSASSLVTSVGKVRASTSLTPPPPPSEEPSVSVSVSSSNSDGDDDRVDVHRVVTRRGSVPLEEQVVEDEEELVLERVGQVVMIFWIFFWCENATQTVLGIDGDTKRRVVRQEGSGNRTAALRE